MWKTKSLVTERLSLQNSEILKNAARLLRERLSKGELKICIDEKPTGDSFLSQGQTTTLTLLQLNVHPS